MKLRPRLTPEQARDIYQFCKAHRWRGSKEAIAKKYGVSVDCVHRIASQQTYRKATQGAP